MLSLFILREIYPDPDIKTSGPAAPVPMAPVPAGAPTPHFMRAPEMYILRPRKA